MEWAWSLGFLLRTQIWWLEKGHFCIAGVRLFSFYPVIHLDEGFSGVDP